MIGALRAERRHVAELSARVRDDRAACARHGRQLHERIGRRLATPAGLLLCFAAGCLSMAYLGVTWIVNHFSVPPPFPPLHQRPLLIYSLGGLLLGAQIMSIGFLGELITFLQCREEDSYSISEQTARGPWTGVRGPVADSSLPPGLTSDPNQRTSDQP